MRIGRGRGVLRMREEVESELEDEDMTEAFLLRADRVAGMVESGDRVEICGVTVAEIAGVDVALSDADGVLDTRISVV